MQRIHSTEWDCDAGQGIFFGLFSTLMTKTTAGWNFDNTFSRLPGQFFAKVNPVPVAAPKLVFFNHLLAKSLGLNADILAADAEIFSGNKIPEGAIPIAQAYAGHQFGHFNMLGDGRAHLLGEQIAPSGERFDLQLKGSGRTPFSRGGDGRAALGPMLREYIISEAMFGLGIPSTRSLAVVTTGEPVYRETPLPGAILTRVSKSHIRVGTFEYAAISEKPESIRILAEYTIDRHYPELVSNPEPYLALLHAVIEKQASLIAKWMHVGFVHGVMNTDNMALSGETIDYGPCAFMDHYSAATLFSSIDRKGRYAYGNQPRIAAWNLARLAEALLPLLDSDPEKATTKAKRAIETFSALFSSHWLAGMSAKLGLLTQESDDVALIESLLSWMEQNRADYTNTFRSLSSERMTDEPMFREAKFMEWHSRWQKRKPSMSLMRATNPVVIPRNHKVEEALAAATVSADFSVMERLLKALEKPFEDSAETEFRLTPPPSKNAYQTFCGT